VDLRSAYRDLIALAIGAGEPGSLPRRPRLVHRFGTPLLLFVTLLLMIATQSGAHRAGWPVQIVAVLGVLPLALVAYRPLVAWRIAASAAVLSEFFPAPGETAWPWAPASVLVHALVLFAVAATQRLWVTVGVWAGTVGLALWQPSPGNRAGLVIFVSLLVLGGDQVRRRGRAQRDLATAEERSAVLSERTRIARELHDVVAHHMSMIAVRAETAPYRLGDIGEPARDEFGQISTAAREGLAEMRRLLGVLRSDKQELLTTPQPDLSDVDELVDAARRAGATVTLQPLPDRAGIPPAVELTAYRLVQEALSNAGRHAPGAPVDVVLARTPDGLSVSVRNGPAGRPPAEAGRGHGLLGMRERVGMLSGDLTVGPCPDGGFEVRMVVPVEGDAG
jgi:signal transduction histidine kinase